MKLLLLLLLAAEVMAGTNSLTSVTGGKVQTAHINQYFTALNQNVVPRNSLGVATDLAGSLGISTLRWSNLWANIVNVGASASAINFTDSSGTLNVNVNSSPVATFSPTVTAIPGVGSTTTTTNIGTNAATTTTNLGTGAGNTTTSIATGAASTTTTIGGTTINLAPGGVTASSVTSAGLTGLAPNAVNTASITASAVTKAKLAAQTVFTTSFSGATTAGTPRTDLSGTLVYTTTAANRPLLIIISAPTFKGQSNTIGGPYAGSLSLNRSLGGVISLPTSLLSMINTWYASTGNANEFYGTGTAFSYIDLTTSASTQYTYSASIQMSAGVTGNGITVSNVNITLTEL